MLMIHIPLTVEKHRDMSLEETIRKIEKKLERIEEEISEMRRQMLGSIRIDERSVISLPDHLRKTAIGLFKVGQGTASEVSSYTNRTRALESAYLNQLEREGYVKSMRDGRHKIFFLENNMKHELSRNTSAT